MQSIKKKKNIRSNKKIVVLLLAVLLVAIALAGTTYYMTQKKEKEISTSSPETPLPSSDTPTDTSTSSDSDDMSSISDNDDEGPTYIDTPITNQPTMSSDYPIENEHYKIEQKTAKNYAITLYPIANNPKYSDYDSQLRAYKNEALRYLQKRYGSITTFTFEWSPENAENA